MKWGLETFLFGISLVQMIFVIFLAWPNLACLSAKLVGCCIENRGFCQHLKNIGKLCNIQYYFFLVDTEAIEIVFFESRLFRHSYSMLAWQQYKFYPPPSLYQFEIMHTYTFSVETCLTLGEE